MKIKFIECLLEPKSDTAYKFYYAPKVKIKGPNLHCVSLEIRPSISLQRGIHLRPSFLFYCVSFRLFAEI